MFRPSLLILLLSHMDHEAIQAKVDRLVFSSQ